MPPPPPTAPRRWPPKPSKKFTAEHEQRWPDLVAASGGQQAIHCKKCGADFAVAFGVVLACQRHVNSCRAVVVPPGGVDVNVCDAVVQQVTEVCPQSE